MGVLKINAGDKMLKTGEKHCDTIFFLSYLKGRKRERKRLIISSGSIKERTYYMKSGIHSIWHILFTIKQKNFLELSTSKNIHNQC